MEKIPISIKEQIDLAAFKLSRLQKEILIKALEKTPQKDGSTRWEPAEWFSDGNPQSDKERASLSRCLARLQKRKLIVRQRIPCSSSTRTHSVKLTELGIRVSRYLQSQNSQLMSNDTSSVNTLNGSTEDAPIHVVVSQVNGRVWIKPSRPVNRQLLIGILSDILYLLQSNTCKTVHPDDCPLRVIIAVDEEQELSEEG